ncbi:MAG: hypothetical protein B7X39_18055 [Lysobacterales bacterium 14-68-21]|jgi:hypothetical protein|nr:MAG: hypothetical protein B7X45_15105 [Xanthomonadales bacterium 15-68-25]OZB63876.1 MAG: hypothetical protein B7X39_18055 [Xanthomonadales bacterium 14-68-21]
MKPRANAAPIAAALPAAMSDAASAQATPAGRHLKFTDLEQARVARCAPVAGRTPALPMQGDRR